jgi:large subunit ribosomal protein L24
MRKIMKIVRNDDVIVIAGNHKGKTGKVKKVLHEKNRVIVEGINMVKRHMKPSQVNPEGGIIEKEASIHISNVALIDPETKKATRVRFEGEKGDKKRVATKSGKEIKKHLV